MKEYLKREYLMLNFSFYRFAFHTIRTPKTYPVRKKQFKIRVPLHHESNNILKNKSRQYEQYYRVRDHWLAKLELHWIAKLRLNCIKIFLR